MNDPRLNLPEWDALSSAERETLARGVGERLPAGFRFAGLERHSLGDQAHEVAVFTHGDSAFVLIPGGTGALGYDADHPFQPTEEQAADWDATIEEWEAPSLHEYLLESLAPLHTATLAPFLLEAQAHPAGLIPVPPEEYLSAAQIAEYQSEPGTNVHLYHADDLPMEIRVDREGRIAVFVKPDLTHAQVVAKIGEMGFRLPTADEWEWACRAGTRTLFRWGDACPTDRIPYGDTGDWTEHTRLNAFGLAMADDTYDWELTATPGLMAGGDGGSNLCGGLGNFAGWIPLASAFRSRWDEKELIGAYLRRAVSLP